MTRARALVPGLLLFALGLLLFRAFEAEDALIVHRYARNLASGHGLVYNLGEPVCALTSPLHGLVCGLLHATVGALAPAVWRVIGAALVLFSSLVLVHRAAVPSDVRGFLLLASGAAPCVVLWSVGGLETPMLYACVALALAVSLQDGVPARRLTWLSALTGLAFLTRFDSVLFFGPLLAATTWRQTRDGELSVPRALLAAAPLAFLLAVSWLGFAWWTYGDVLPTSFHAKVARTLPSLLRSAAYAAQFLVVSGAPLAWWAARGRARDRSPAPVPAPVRAAGLALLVIAPYLVYVADLHMMFAYRTFVPYVPAMALLLALRLRRHGRRPRRAATAIAFQHVAVALWMTFVGVNPAVTSEYSATSLASYRRFLDDLRDVASAVAADWRESGDPARPLRLQTFTAGMPYHLPSDVYVLDDQGLVSGREELPRWLGDVLPQFADYVHFKWSDRPDAPAAVRRRAAALEHHRVVARYPLRLPRLSAVLRGDTSHEHLFMQVVRRDGSFDPRESFPPRFHDPLPPGSRLRALVTPAR